MKVTVQDNCHVTKLTATLRDVKKIRTCPYLWIKLATGEKWIL